MAVDEQHLRLPYVCDDRPSKIKPCAASVVTTWWRCERQGTCVRKQQHSSAAMLAVQTGGAGLIKRRWVVWRWINLDVNTYPAEEDLVKGDRLDVRMHFAFAFSGWWRLTAKNFEWGLKKKMLWSHTGVSCREAPPCSSQSAAWALNTDCSLRCRASCCIYSAAVTVQWRKGIGMESFLT